MWLCGLLLLCLFAPGPSLSGDEPAPQKIRPQSYGYFDFPTCVRFAVSHSEELLKNRLEIQIRSADLKDAHAEILPSIIVGTSYYWDRAASTTNPNANPFTVRVYMGAWNPYLAIGKIKARGILVDIAKDAHAEKIAGGVAKVAKLFFAVYSAEQEIKARRHILALRKRSLQYWETLRKQDRISDVELKARRHNVDKMRLRIKYLEQKRKYLIADLKLAIGYHPDYHLPLDTRDAPNQILAGFQGDLVTFSDIQARNLNLRMLAKREQLQSSLVTGAYVELLPRPMLTMESLTNEVDRSNGLNFGFGLHYNIWDGFKRIRNIRRQKLELRKLHLDRNMLSKQLYNQYRKLHTKLEMSGEQERLYLEAVRLAEYQAEQAYSQYTAGKSDYPSYIRAVISKLNSKMEGLNLLEQRVTALIDLATLAGGLDNYNGAISR